MTADKEIRLKEENQKLKEVIGILDNKLDIRYMLDDFLGLQLINQEQYDMIKEVLYDDRERNSIDY